MRNRYDMQLHLLDTQLTHMGELCETAIAKVTQALKEGNTEQAKIVIKEDEEIDQIEKDIERLCLKLLLLSLIHISEPTRLNGVSRMPSSA